MDIPPEASMRWALTQRLGEVPPEVSADERIEKNNQRSLLRWFLLLRFRGLVPHSRVAKGFLQASWRGVISNPTKAVVVGKSISHWLMLVIRLRVVVFFSQKVGARVGLLAMKRVNDANTHNPATQPRSAQTSPARRREKTPDTQDWRIADIFF
jgi:hypothetical protein